MMIFLDGKMLDGLVVLMMTYGCKGRLLDGEINGKYMGMLYSIFFLSL